MTEFINALRNPTWLKLALRQLKGSRSFALTYVLNLALGLSGFLALDLYRESFQEYFAFRARSILSSDIAIGSRRPLTDEEMQQARDILGPNNTPTLQARFLSMVASGEASRLCSLIASEPGFPLTGQFLFDDGSIVTNSKELNEGATAWIYPEVAIELDVKIGQDVTIGARKFKVTRIIKDDPAGSSGAFEFAPRVYIGHRWLAETQLIQKGSRIEYRSYYMFDPNGRNLLTPEKTQKALQKAIASPEISILLPVNATSQLGRAFGYLTDYLALIAMVGLFVVLVANIYLLRGFIAAREKDIGIMRAVGATPLEASFVYIWQTVILSATSIGVGVALAMIYMPVLNSALAAFLPKDFAVQIPWLHLPAVLGSMFCVSLLASAPALVLASRIKPLTLLQKQPVSLGRWTQSAALLMPAAFVFWAMAVLVSKSLRTGSLFCAGLAGAGLAAILIGLAGGLLLRRLQLGSRSLVIKHALRTVTRSPGVSLAGFAVVVVVTTLLAAVPQLRNILAADLDEGGQAKTPSLFLFDIQPDQEKSVTDQIAQSGSSIANLSPMVVARLIEVNGKVHQRLEEGSVNSREDEEARSTRSRTFNLSWRSSLSPSESIVEGAFNQRMSDLPAISLEYRFAERMGLGLGDVMTFDVQGVEIKGQVTSTRRVKWRSFQPNFFVSFEPGPLGEAPRTSVAALYANDSDSRLRVQKLLVRKFANISTIDVTRTIARIDGIITQMSKVITLVAALSAIAGLFVIYALATYQSRLRHWEMNIMRVLGETRSGLLTGLAVEFTLISGTAALTGCALGTGIAAMLNYYLFEATFSVSWLPLAWTAAVMYLASLAIGIFSSRRRLRAKPIELLREGA